MAPADTEAAWGTRWFPKALQTGYFGPPPTMETYEEHLAILRQSIEDMKAGVGGVEARKFLKELAIRHNLPLEPGE